MKKSLAKNQTLKTKQNFKARRLAGYAGIKDIAIGEEGSGLGRSNWL